MTSQKTIEKCRTRVKELEDINSSLVIANKTLLDNNVKLAEENAKLRMEAKDKADLADRIESQRKACVMKCETAISEKNRILQERENYISNLHDTIWHLRNSFKCESYQFSETQNGFKFSFEFGRKP